jgi:hypothetical protein
MGQVAAPRDLDHSSPRLNTTAPDVHRDSAYHCIGTTEQTLVHGSFYLPFLSTRQKERQRDRMRNLVTKWLFYEGRNTNPTQDPHGHTCPVGYHSNRDTPRLVSPDLESKSDVTHPGARWHVQPHCGYRGPMLVWWTQNHALPRLAASGWPCQSLYTCILFTAGLALATGSSGSDRNNSHEILCSLGRQFRNAPAHVLFSGKLSIDFAGHLV